LTYQTKPASCTTWVTSVLHYNRICHKNFMLFSEQTQYVFCQVIRMISHCVCRKTDGLKRLIFFGTNYFCCIHYTFIHIQSNMNGFNFFAIIWQTATLPWTAAAFDLVAMTNTCHYHCRSDLRFCNLSSLHFTSRKHIFV
jgi:hypothetical protein